MPSLRYQQKREDLWRQYREGKFDHTKYLALLEQLKDEEIKTARERSSIGLMPSEVESIENGIWKYERDIQEELEQAERLKSLTPLEKYKEEVPKTINRYRDRSNNYRRTANWFQIIVIVGSVLVTSATSAIGFGIGDIFRWIAPAISILVAISAGLAANFKFRERSFNLQQTADAIEQEYMAVELGIGYYKGKQPQEVLELFAERVEFMKDEQKKRQQQLEQPPDMKHGQSHL